MLKKRNTIIYIPYNVKGEKVLEYTVNMIKILEKRYDVVGELAEMWDIFSMINTKAVFLNWMEERLDREIKLKLIMYKAMGAKIIWVFHNRFPLSEVNNFTFYHITPENSVSNASLSLLPVLRFLRYCSVSGS